MSNSIIDLSSKQLRQAAKLKEKIAALQTELERLVGDDKPMTEAKPKKKRKMSAAARKAISLAQKKRWAKEKKEAKAQG